MPIGNELDARGIAAEVAKEIEAEQDAAKSSEKPEAEAPKEEPKPEPEAKAEERREDPKEEIQDEPKPERAEQRSERKSKYVPVSKANAWRHEANESKAKVAELEQKLAELQSAQEKAKASDIEAVAKEVAGEDASPEVVKRILEATKRLATPEPSEDIKSVLALKQRLEEQAEEAGFQKELNSVLARFPELKGHEDVLKETAYAEGNEKIPLDLLAYRVRDELNLTAKPPSAEGKASQAAPEPEIDFSRLTEAQLEKLSDADMDKFIEWQREGVQKRKGIRLQYDRVGIDDDSYIKIIDN